MKIKFLFFRALERLLFHLASILDDLFKLARSGWSKALMARGNCARDLEVSISQGLQHE